MDNVLANRVGVVVPLPVLRGRGLLRSPFGGAASAGAPREVGGGGCARARFPRRRATPSSRRTVASTGPLPRPLLLLLSLPALHL